MSNTILKEFQFLDKRSPHEVKLVLERELWSLFNLTMENEKLCLRTRTNVVGADYDFLLRFEAAFPKYNCYSLRMHVSWPNQNSSNSDYYGKTSESWFALWTRDFAEADLPLADEGSGHLYQQLSEIAFKADSQLDTVPAVQQAILAVLRGGAAFRASHKEGGTRIYWKSDCFVRSDFGDHPEERRFENELEFLKMLLRFFHVDVTRNSGSEQRTELDTWRLILRRVDHP